MSKKGDGNARIQHLSFEKLEKGVHRDRTKIITAFVTEERKERYLLTRYYLDCPHHFYIGKEDAPQSLLTSLNISHEWGTVALRCTDHREASERNKFIHLNPVNGFIEEIKKDCGLDTKIEAVLMDRKEFWKWRKDGLNASAEKKRKEMVGIIIGGFLKQHGGKYVINPENRQIEILIGAGMSENCCYYYTLGLILYGVVRKKPESSLNVIKADKTPIVIHDRLLKEEFKYISGNEMENFIKDNHDEVKKQLEEYFRNEENDTLLTDIYLTVD
jgi:hypothetical protein